MFRTIVFIFIVISTTFQPICPPAFFRCLSNSGTFTELRTTSFIETTGVACSDSVSHNWVQVLSIPVLLLACSEDWTCNIQMIVSLEAQGTNANNRYAMWPAGLFNVVWMVSALFTIFNSSSPLIKILRIVSTPPITTGITVNLMFHIITIILLSLLFSSFHISSNGWTSLLSECQQVTLMKFQHMIVSSIPVYTWNF